jgi:hypothetical protein
MHAAQLCADAAHRLSIPSQQDGSTSNVDASPIYLGYKGVAIGMSMDEARKKLGKPSNKSGKTDFFIASDQENAQVFYDKDQKVTAISVTYSGNLAKAPKPREVLGMGIETKPDGSQHRLERYPKAGYWVSYSRTAGDQAVIVISMRILE